MNAAYLCPHCQRPMRVAHTDGSWTVYECADEGRTHDTDAPAHQATLHVKE